MNQPPPAAYWARLLSVNKHKQRINLWLELPQSIAQTAASTSNPIE